MKQNSASQGGPDRGNAQRVLVPLDSDLFARARFTLNTQAQS